MEARTYWNNNGLFQEEYEELIKSNVKWTKSEENAKHRYYRYFNDGDIPGGATHANKKEVETYLETQASIAIAKAYKRTHKGENVGLLIDCFATRELKGFKAWETKR